jgi:hypothetical protein
MCNAAEMAGKAGRYGELRKKQLKLNKYIYKCISSELKNVSLTEEDINQVSGKSRSECRLQKKRVQTRI